MMITLSGRFRRRLPLTLAVQLFVVFVCGTVLVAEITESLHSRQRELRDSRTDAVNLSRSIGRHLDDCFDLAEVLLTSVVSRVNQLPINAETLKELHVMMRQSAAYAPVIDGINLYDEHGYWLANSFSPSTVPYVYTIADRPIFKYHQNHEDLGTHVGAVGLSRATGKSVVVVSRRFNKPDGSFGGMVSVSISMDYFQHYMKAFDIGSLGTMYVASSVDRMVLARVPYSAEIVGRSFPAGTIWPHVEKTPDGVWTSPSQTDGRIRINSYHA
ncbi:MAG TPA: hypothetical protein VL574_05210, partial [Stellaceae bacterium]|nr:hypothetical protein [Stellaceae bacterium]